MSNTKFDRVVSSPASKRLLRFADQRIRWREVLIETVDRKPWRVHRSTRSILQFGEQGCVDADRYEAQQMAKVVAMLVHRCATIQSSIAWP